MKRVSAFIRRLFRAGEFWRVFFQENFALELVDILIGEYRKSERRLILLDYDGTLVPFADKPSDAEPDEDLLELLGSLARDDRNEVVIVSGRDRSFLEKWFGGKQLGLVAEHGAWVRVKGAGWRLTGPLEDGWKREVFPLLEECVKNTPGSFIEEKSFSLVWHYRKADPLVGRMRARSLKEKLTSLAARLGLEVSEGNMVVEVKNLGVNKGRAVLYWTSKADWDFILAIGDDVTDEDMFAALPSQSYSVKVGVPPSQAKFFVRSVEDVRTILRGLAESSMRSHAHDNVHHKKRIFSWFLEGGATG